MIEKYLMGNCLSIIDEFNERYKGIDNKILKDISDLEFNEADLVIRLGYPLRQMANFNMQGSSHDIVVKSKDFIIEVKYLRNFTSNSIKKGEFRTNKLKWSEAFEKDFLWLTDEINKGKKGNRAFVIGWFNIPDRQFGDIMQLGESKGQNPIINTERIRLFPFLNYDPISNKVKDIKYRYGNGFSESKISYPGTDEQVDCIFFGTESDVFHFALYF